jgi:hypothetical protein
MNFPRRMSRFRGKTKVTSNFLEHPYSLVPKWLAWEAGVDPKVRCSSPDVGNFLMDVLYLLKYLFKLCRYMLFNYMFKNFHMYLILKSNGNGYRNM